MSNPPFDGKPCPACPCEIRNLHAVAHNLIAQWRGGRTDAFKGTLLKLEDAVKSTQPLMDEHFSDPSHSGSGVLSRKDGA